MWLSFLFLAIIVTVILCYRYYYSKTKDDDFETIHVLFEFVKEIPKPSEDFDGSQWFTYDYIRNEERLMFFLVDWYKGGFPEGIRGQGYDPVFVQNLNKELNFDKYDYLIVYQRRLIALTYSPYLAKKYDGMCHHEKRKPLIPTFDTEITDKVYIYRIKKNDKFRPPGP